MTKSLYLPIHSFVNLITNSSSEIFVCADESTVEAVKAVIDNLLKGAGSDKTADELFTFTLTVEIDNPETYEERKISGKGYTLTVDVNSAEGKQAIEDYSGDNPQESGILVTPKDGTNENLVLAAKTLSNLTGLFQIEASYNG
jgi:hypothetical protein